MFLMIGHATEKGEYPIKLLPVIVVFVTEQDYFKSNKPVERFRMMNEDGKCLTEKVEIFYVNAACSDVSTEAGKLIHDIRCADPNKMYSSILANRARECKTTREEQKNMCCYFEKRLAKERKKNIIATISLLREFGCSENVIFENIVKKFSLTEAEAKECMQEKESAA